MTIQATIDKLEEMKIYGMTRALKSTMELGFSGLGIEELLAHLVDAEYDDRQNRRLNRLLKAARFRYNASTAEIDFCLSRNFTKDSFLCLFR